MINIRKIFALCHFSGHISVLRGFSDSLLFLVGAQCLLLLARRWERVHPSVMRLTCGSIAEVMMSSLDGEVSAADSFHHHHSL